MIKTMDVTLESNLEDDYEFRLKFIENLKKEISLRLFALKVLFFILLLILVYGPVYLAIYSLSIYVNVLFLGNFNSWVIYYPFIFFLLAIIPIILIFKGILRLNLFFFLLGSIIMIFFDKDYNLWLVKFIGLLIFYKIPENYQKYSKALKNYQTYKESYLELYLLKRTFDISLKNYIFNMIRLLILSYLVLILFELISINLGTEISIVLPLILLPVISLSLFLSPYIFTHVKKYYKENKLPFF